MKYLYELYNTATEQVEAYQEMMYEEASDRNMNFRIRGEHVRWIRAEQDLLKLSKEIGIL